MDRIKEKRYSLGYTKRRRSKKINSLTNNKMAKLVLCIQTGNKPHEITGIYLYFLSGRPAHRHIKVRGGGIYGQLGNGFGGRSFCYRCH
jgi:hypothetical protein